MWKAVVKPSVTSASYAMLSRFTSNSHQMRQISHQQGATQCNLWWKHPVLSAKYMCLPKDFCGFLSIKTYRLLIRTLKTKSNVWTTTYTVRRYVNTKADENF